MREFAATIGTFDGVHTGHKLVLKTLIEEAEKNALTPVAITFDRHPLSLVDKSREPASICGHKEKISLIEKTGVKTEVITFDDRIRNLTAKLWMKKIREELGVRLLVIGYDNRFGSDGFELTMEEYKTAGRDCGIEMIWAPELKGVSSSKIRSAIKNGDMESVFKMLGRNYEISGKVMKGQSLGRTIGYPTANITPEEKIGLPKEGVYAAIAVLPDNSEWPAMVNIGRKPTVGFCTMSEIEAHIIGWQGNLYSKEVKLRFIRRLRDEIKFNSLEELRNQLNKDKEEVLELLKDNSYGM